MGPDLRRRLGRRHGLLSGCRFSWRCRHRCGFGHKESRQGHARRRIEKVFLLEGRKPFRRQGGLFEFRFAAIPCATYRRLFRGMCREEKRRGRYRRFPRCRQPRPRQGYRQAPIRRARVASGRRGSSPNGQTAIINFILAGVVLAKQKILRRNGLLKFVKRAGMGQVDAHESAADIRSF